MPSLYSYLDDWHQTPLVFGLFRICVSIQPAEPITLTDRTKSFWRFWGRRVNANLLALSKMEIWIWNCKEGGGPWQDCHVMCLSLQLSSQNTCFPRGNSDQTSNFYWLHNEYVFIYIFNCWGLIKLHSHSSPWSISSEDFTPTRPENKYVQV